MNVRFETLDERNRLPRKAVSRSDPPTRPTTRWIEAHGIDGEHVVGLGVASDAIACWIGVVRWVRDRGSPGYPLARAMLDSGADATTRSSPMSRRYGLTATLSPP